MQRNDIEPAGRLKFPHYFESDLELAKQIDLTISRTGKKKSDVIREALVHGLEKVEGKQPL